MLKYILFVNEIFLVEELQEDVNYKLKMWRKALESKEFCLSINKIEYMECKFKKRQTNND